MANAYTVFWTRERCKNLRKLGWAGRQLETLFGGPHTSEPSFQVAGVRAGDWVYPITVQSGVVYVLGRTQVQSITRLDTYVQQHTDLFWLPLNEPPTHAHSFSSPQYQRAQVAFDRYRSTNPAVAILAPTCTDEVVVCENGMALRFDLTVPPDLLARLRYRSQRRERDLSQHLHDGRLVHSVAVQGIYRLTETSAYELETLLCGTAVPPLSE